MGFFARVTRRDHRAIEEALAGATLLTESPDLGAVVVEASYASDNPPLLKRLREDGTASIVDPQSLRFTGARYLEVDALAALPYAPVRPVVINEFTAATAADFTRRALAFEQSSGADVYLAPGLPLYDHDLSAWEQANEAILAAACSANGGADLDRKPMLALVAPGARAMREPEKAVDRLLDFPVDGIYLQPLRLNPLRDSLEKLARFVQFAHALRETGLPVVVGRVGAFGLVLQALGVTAFDSGLGQAEAHDLATLNRPLSDAERRRRKEKGGAGPAQRVYLEPLMTTLGGDAAASILADGALRHRFTCKRSCCRFRGFENFGERARQHYLWTRQGEVEALRKRPVPAMRMTHVESQLRGARDTALVVRRSLESRDLPAPDFTHLDRWLGLLAREEQLALAS